MIFLLFNSLTTTTTRTPVPNPSFDIYKEFQILYPKTFECPCSNRVIPYEPLISISPTLHQICSSDFITDRWLSIVANIYDHTPQDWRNRANGYFNLLSRICQLANNTINDSIRQFLLQSFILTNILSEVEFNAQINAILNEFFQTTIKSFISLIDIVHILTQIDQFYMGSISSEWDSIPDKNLIPNISIDNKTNVQSLKVLVFFF